MTSVAIIFDNFGPYHIARLQAATTVCDLLAIEVAGQSSVYAWEKTAAATTLRRVTLFEQTASDAVSRAELIRRLEKTLDSFQPAAVVVPGWASSAAWGAMQWCLHRRVPMVVMSESTAWDEPRAVWKEWIKRQLVALFASALVGGKHHRDYLAGLGLPAERISFGYDVVDNLHFSTAAEALLPGAGNVMAKYNLPTNYFLASARFVEKKNLPRLLDAYALYRRTSQLTTPWSLVLLGDGVLRPALEQKRDALGLRDHVLMPGFRQIEDLPSYYALAGAFIHVSTTEPWGLVVNEAMACDRPILVSNRCGCVPELVREGVNGFTFDPLDLDAMAASMRQISAPDFPLVEFGKASRAIIAEWSPHRFAQGLSQAIAAALAHGPAQPTWLQHALLALLLRR